MQRTNSCAFLGLRLILKKLLPMLLLLGGCGGDTGAAPPELSDQNAQTEILNLWKENMLIHGRSLCERLKNYRPESEQALAETYYDASWVFWQIADYTKEPYWQACAQAAAVVYRDHYVLTNNGNVPGYWNFSHGLAEDYLRTKNSNSKTAVDQLASKAAFARLNTPMSETQDAELSREVAYTIMSYINAERLGSKLPQRFDQLRNQAFDHLNQWFNTRTAQTLKPFMVGLTAQALIEAHNTKAHEHTIPKLKEALEKLWQRAWVPDKQSFRYQIINGSAEDLEASPDLNLLIAPAYLWIYNQTQEPEFLEYAKQIFASGVKNAYLGNGKQFNQNYRWSIQYVYWLKN